MIFSAEQMKQQAQDEHPLLSYGDGHAHIFGGSGAK